MSHPRGKGQDKPSQIFAECMSPSSCRSESHSDVKVKVESDDRDPATMKLEIYHQHQNVNLEPTAMHQQWGANFAQGKMQPPQHPIQPPEPLIQPIVPAQLQPIPRPTVIVPIMRANRSRIPGAVIVDPRWFQGTIHMELNSTTGTVQLLENNTVADFRPIYQRGFNQTIRRTSSGHFPTEVAIEVDEVVIYFIKFNNVRDTKLAWTELRYCCHSVNEYTK